MRAKTSPATAHPWPSDLSSSGRGFVQQKPPYLTRSLTHFILYSLYSIYHFFFFHLLFVNIHENNFYVNQFSIYIQLLIFFFFYLELTSNAAVINSQILNCGFFMNENCWNNWFSFIDWHTWIFVMWKSRNKNIFPAWEKGCRPLSTFRNITTMSDRQRKRDVGSLPRPPTTTTTLTVFIFSLL